MLAERERPGAASRSTSARADRADRGTTAAWSPDRAWVAVPRGSRDKEGLRESRAKEGPRELRTEAAVHRIWMPACPMGSTALVRWTLLERATPGAPPTGDAPSSIPR